MSFCLRSDAWHTEMEFEECGPESQVRINNSSVDVIDPETAEKDGYDPNSILLFWGRIQAMLWFDHFGYQ